MQVQVSSQAAKLVADSALIGDCGPKVVSASKVEGLAALFRAEEPYTMGNELKLYLRLLIAERGVMDGSLDHIADAVSTSARNVRNWMDKLVEDGRLETERLAHGRIRISLVGDDLALARMEDLPLVESHIADEAVEDPEKNRLIQLYDVAKAAGAAITVTSTATFESNA